ncbi:DNA repair protein RecO [Congregibacter litoralis]|uniref:DNA repair protein RecO n=1 Tax=Congregibacter litoralis KT71 TaxID=314285 RepID=A4A3U3_9GAMM|nr:DNA repair protein RecO [Congregibacter litoralis]EAQ99366.1 DNA replication and repair protein RecO [Congregibacter litoralis KT71]
MRVQLEPCYLLHRRPFRDNSELLDVFSVAHGRLGLVARGLSRRRRGGSLGAVLQPFRPLLLSFSGKGELLTLTGAESGGALPPLHGDALLSAFYLNELLLRLLQRFEEQPAIFTAYGAAIGDLCDAANHEQERTVLEPALRRFEFRLLEELGYAVNLDVEASRGTPIREDGHYALVPEYGLREIEGDVCGSASSFTGEQIMAIADGRFDGEHAPAAKKMARALLQPQLGNAPLRSRSMFETARVQPSSDGGNHDVADIR